MEALINFLAAIGGALWPPKEFTGARAYGWAVLITVITMANLTGNILITAGVMGYLSAIYPGAASASDLKQARADAAVQLKEAVAPVQNALTLLQQSQKMERIRGLNNDLLALRTKLCAAEKANNGSAKEFAEGQFNDSYAEYQNLSGISWRIPDCTELN